MILLIHAKRLVFFMKKLILPLLFFFCGCKDESSNQENLLKVGMSVDYAPYEFYLDGNIVGFDADLAREIAKRLEKKIEFQDMGFEGLIAALQTKKVDLVISCFTKTKERAQKVDFSRNYYKNKNQLLVMKTASVKTINDAKKIGVQSGSTHESFAKNLQKENPNLEIKSLSKTPDLLQEIKTGMIDGLLLGSSEAKRITKSQKEFKILDVDQETEAYAIALPKNSPLKTSVDKIIGEMEDDGTLQKLKAKWLEE
jgi:ABC-type amino acid transport substrate-binding protein